MNGRDDATFRPDDDGMDETLRPTAYRVRRVLQSSQMRPDFRAQLRDELVAAREDAIAEREAALARDAWPTGGGAGAGPPTRRPGRTGRGTRHRPPGRPRPLRRRRQVWGWAGTIAAVAVAGAVLVFHGTAVSPSRGVRVSVLSNVDGAASATTTALRLTFSQPLDHTATAAALRLAPATQVRSAWEGDTLTVTPVYGFAPNSA